MQTRWLDSDFQSLQAFKKHLDRKQSTSKENYLRDTGSASSNMETQFPSIPLLPTESNLTKQMRKNLQKTKETTISKFKQVMKNSAKVFAV